MRVDTERARDLDDVMARMRARDERLPLLGGLDRLPRARGRRSAASVLMRGDHAELRRAGGRAARRRRSAPPPARLAAPPWVPDGLLNRATVARVQRGCTSAARPRGARAPGAAATRSSTRSTSCAAGTGSTGRAASCSTSWSCPFGARGALRAALERLSGARRRLVPGRAQALRRPSAACSRSRCAGWTLALDMPAGAPGLAALLDGLDELVAGPAGASTWPRTRACARSCWRAMYPRLGRVARGPRAARPGAASCARTWPAPGWPGGDGMKDALGSRAERAGAGRDVGHRPGDRARRWSTGGRARVVLAARDPQELEPAAAELGRGRRRAGRGAGLRRRRHRTRTPRSIDERVRRASATSTWCWWRSASWATRSGCCDDPAAARGRGRRTSSGAASATLAVAERLRAPGPRHDRGAVVSVAGERARQVELRLRLVEGGAGRVRPGPGRRARRPTGVHVMVVRPGFVRTKMTAGMDPAPFTTTPEAVADAIVGGLRARLAHRLGAADPAPGVRRAAPPAARRCSGGWTCDRGGGSGRTRRRRRRGPRGGVDRAAGAGRPPRAVDRAGAGVLRRSRVQTRFLRDDSRRLAQIERLFGLWGRRVWCGHDLSYSTGRWPGRRCGSHAGRLAPAGAPAAAAAAGDGALTRGCAASGASCACSDRWSPTTRASRTTTCRSSGWRRPGRAGAGHRADGAGAGALRPRGDAGLPGGEQPAQPRVLRAQRLRGHRRAVGVRQPPIWPMWREPREV